MKQTRNSSLAGCGRKGLFRSLLAHPLECALALVLASTPLGGAFANPLGAQVERGAATIQGQGTSTVTVNQSTQSAIINWNTFNIKTGELTQFNQPNAGAVALNRVTGGLGPSQIYGTIQANGKIFLVNPDGILFGLGSRVDTAGFLATTNDISNDNFMAGQYRFNIPGRLDASIVNLGRITATNSGFAALVAPGVRNAGVISANLGHVALASGNGFTLDFYGDKLITLQVGDEVANQVIDVATGKPLSALVKNEGKLQANGGTVSLTAVAARQVVDSVINNSGVIEANSVGTRNGMIVLGAATGAHKPRHAPTQKVVVSGTLSVQGTGDGEKGGNIFIRGGSVTLSGARINGSRGATAQIRAHDITVADGGLMSTGLDSLTLRAFNSIDVDAPITVYGATTLNMSAAYAPELEGVPLISFGPGDSVQFVGTRDGQALIINDQRYTLLYDMSDVQAINANSDSLSGYYALARPIDASGMTGWVPIGTDGNGRVLRDGSGFSGTFQGLGNTISNLTINLASTSSVGVFGYIGYDGIVSNLGIVGGSVTGGFNVGALAGANSGTITQSYASSAVTGSGGVGGLVGSNSGMVSLSYATGQVQGTGGDDVGGLVGYNAGGTVAQSYATGNVSGPLDVGGLVGDNSFGTVTQSYATGAITGTNTLFNFGVGGLVGYMYGGSISESYATGAVSAPSYVGGLVGWSFGTITQSYATGAVNGSSNVGGLAGINGGSISLSYATGAVNGTTNVGGLIGYNSGSIDQTYSTGAPTGSQYVGGLVGYNAYGDSYGVKGEFCEDCYFHDGLITNSYWDVNTSQIGGHNGVGNQVDAAGVAGLTTQQFGNAANFSGWTFGTTPGGSGWVIVDTDGTLNNANGAAGATRPMLLSEWSTTITNAHQLELINLDLNGHYQLASNIDLGAALANRSDVFGPSGSAGFVPVGRLDNTFNGSFNGRGHTIAGLSVAPTDINASEIGLFGVNDGTIRDLHLTDVSITSNPNSPFQNVGTLAGLNFGTIKNVTASGVVGSQNDTVNAGVGAVAGGLVGSNFGLIYNAFAIDETVHVGAQGIAGGLVGFNSGGIWQSFAAVRVTGDAGHGSANDSFDSATFLGGLVGDNQGRIAFSSATGDVGTSDLDHLEVGGLVAHNSGVIQYSFATGNVLAGNFSAAGGLVAENNPGGQDCDCTPGLATISHSAAIGDEVVVGSNGIGGGLVAINQGTINDSLAWRNVSGADNSILGGLVAVNDLTGLIDRSAAWGSVTSTGPNSAVAGLVGVNGGAVQDSNSRAAVRAVDNSYVGGLAAINIGTIVDSHVIHGASVRIDDGGTGNIVGGFVGANMGMIDPSTTIVIPVAGPGNIVGSFAGANLAFEPAIFGGLSVPPPSFPAGTISDDSQNNSGASNPPPFTGTTSASSNPVTPGVINSCTDALCQIFQTGFLTSSQQPQQPLPPDQLPQQPTNTGSPIDALPPPQQVIVPPTFTFGNQPTLVNLTNDSGSGNGNGGNGGNHNGNGGNGSNNSPGPPPGPGLGRTLDEQRFSGVPPIGETRFLKGEVVVQISDTVPMATVLQIARRLGITLVSSQSVDLTGRVIYRFKAANGKDIRILIRALERNRIIASAQPNYVFGLTQSATAPAAPAAQPAPEPDHTDSIPPTTPAEPDLANANTAALETLPAGDAAQYIIDKMHLVQIHHVARGRGVVVAVIDSEIDLNHPDLKGVIIDRFDATQTPSHPHSHGTGMAGAIAAHKRLLGIAPGVRLIAIKAFDAQAASAEATSFQILKGLDYAIDHKARIINMSFAGPRDPMMERTLKLAHDKGIILVAAAGNAGPKSPPLYPGADKDVIAVTASDYNDKPFAMANRGKYIAVGAPGVDVMVPAPGNTYQLTTGTSVATAHVSGVAALLVERKPNITPDEVRAILMRTATPFSSRPKGEEDGAGLVDPVAALQALSPNKAATNVPRSNGVTLH